MPIKKILVVDDEIEMAKLMKINLQKLNYKVEMSFSGKDAIKKIQQFNPDVITLDILMPELNGLQVLELIKNNSSMNNIPVIIISAINNVHKEYALKLGAIDYLSKPVDFEKLYQRLKNLEKE